MSPAIFDACCTHPFMCVRFMLLSHGTEPYINNMNPGYSSTGSCLVDLCLLHERKGVFRPNRSTGMLLQPLPSFIYPCRCQAEYLVGRSLCYEGRRSTGCETQHLLLLQLYTAVHPLTGHIAEIAERREYQEYGICQPIPLCVDNTPTPPGGSWGILPAAGAPLCSSCHCLPTSCLLEWLKTQRDCVLCCS